MRRLFVASTILLLCGACQKPQTRLNAPPHGPAERTSPMQAQYVYMTDNALLEDMTVSDCHFMPHRAMLNTLGTERLERLAALMDAFGGIIRFNTDEADEALVDARTKTILDFLKDAGVDTYADVLTQDQAGGTGMLAREAILIRANEATYKPKKSADVVGGVPMNAQP